MSNEDPVAFGLTRDDRSVGKTVSVQDISLVAVFAAVVMTTIASLVAFVAVYVYLEATVLLLLFFATQH